MSVSSEVIKEGIQWAWQSIRRDVFAAVFVAAGETVENALSMSKTLDIKLADIEEEEANPKTEPDPPPEP